MTLYDPENPQHLDYLARARAQVAARRAAEAMSAWFIRTNGRAEALDAARIHWANKTKASS